MPSTWSERTYSVPERPVTLRCTQCGVAVAGGHRGSRNPRGILKDLKRHDESHHPPYSAEIVRLVDLALCELNEGALPPLRIGRRLELDYFG
jgi:hypothetical protein